MQQPPEQKSYTQRMAIWVLIFLVGAILLTSSYYLDGASLGVEGGSSESGALAWAGLGVTAISAIGGLITSYAALKTARQAERAAAQQQPPEQRGPEARWSHARTAPRRRLRRPSSHRR
ncbi:hypothetical protein ACFUTV_38725 [Streptomyces sp. NPDC057298]|uniref:hypothetical protein n=1 Tax=Streptomyces sp. NPDC057298 TaxID=3346091 RepID=UPI00362E8B31